MDSGGYNLAWTVYCVAGVVLSYLCWIVLRKISFRELGWLLQFWLLALLFTPWYVLPDEDVMAPALMIFVMDAITVDMTSAIRALIPLIMAMLLGILLTAVMSIVYRFRRRKSVQ